MEKYSPINSNIEADFTLLFYLRFFVYVYCSYKIIDIVFLKRQKIKAKDKVERKIMHSHGPVIVDSLSHEDKQLLQLTINNTFQNATQPLAGDGKKSMSGTSKKVNFMMECNVYYEPHFPNRSSGSSQSNTPPC